MNSSTHQQHHQNARRLQKHVHLHGNAQRMKEASPSPMMFRQEPDGNVPKQGGDAVIEESKHKQGVNSLGEDQKNANPDWKFVVV
jgi:hypothetical protein